MPHSSELKIIIPVYNEAANLNSLIDDWYELFESMDIPFTMVVINDGSSDKSQVILETMQQIKPRLKIYSQKNVGHGPSIFKGYVEGLDSAWVFQIDGDNQFETNSFRDLWEQKENFDLLVAERKSKNASLGRQIVSAISSLLVRLFFGKGIRDVNSPYRLIRTKALREAITLINPDTFAPNVLISSYFIHAKKRIYTNKAILRQKAVKNQSRMSLHIFQGCIRSIFSVIKFRLSI